MKRFLALVVAFITIFSFVPQSAAFETELFEAPPSQISNEYAQDEVLVKFKGSNRFQRIQARRGERVEVLIERYRSRFDVEYAEPNYIAHAFLVPNDPYY